MNIISNSISRFCIAILAVSALFGCQKDELVKPSALLAESSVTVSAKGGEGSALTVYSDEAWVISSEQEWITVTPSEGTGTMDVIVTAEDNVDASGAINKPRQGKIFISNRREKATEIEVVVYQDGDNYKGVANKTLAELYQMKDGEFAKVPAAQVVAVTAEGFVATDKSASIYVAYDQKGEKATIGDLVHFAGERVTLYGMPALVAGECFVDSSDKLVYPEASDLMKELSKPATVKYVSTDAGLLGRDLYYEDSVPASVTLLDSKSVNLDQVNMHNISIKAYLVGFENGNVKLAVTEVKDNGLNENLDAYFYDDFSWMKPFIDGAEGVKVGDTIGEKNASASAPNLRTTAPLTPLLDEFVKRGYQDLNQEAKVIYPQAYYWKFGKTSKDPVQNNGGLVLPKIEFKGSEQANVFVEFDWAAHMTGSGNVDDVQIVVEVEGPGMFDNGTNVSDPIFTAQKDGELAWQHAKVQLKGANNKTKITLRPLNYALPVPKQQRWHIDNIKIKDTGVPYSDPVFANVTLSDEVVAFDGTPTSPVALKIKSDNSWTLTKGQGCDWFDLDVLEGSANDEVTVSFTCQPSSSVTLRRGVVVLASADTRKNIHVVQSAAGGELDPLISIVTGNRVTVLGEGEDIAVTVQANVEYKVEISEPWITEVPIVVTKGLVEKSGHKFTAAPNVTGASRTASIRFYNETNGIESVLHVTQENFEARVDVSPAKGAYLGISGLGGTYEYAISSNIPFTVSTNADWVTLPAAEGKVGEYSVPVTFAANGGAVRAASLTFRNEKYGFEKVVSLNQFASGVIFADDFSWLQPLVDAAKAATPGDYDTVGNKNLSAKAPNIYHDAKLNDAFVPLRDAIGYEIPVNAEVLYLQECYLKFGKTSNHTSITLPSVDPSGKDIELSFDWARMVQGSGTVDPFTLTAIISGNGAFENGTKYSEPFKTSQTTGQIFWSKQGVRISGADKSTKVTLVATEILDKTNGKIDYSKKKARRFFIDNILVKVL